MHALRGLGRRLGQLQGAALWATASRLVLPLPRSVRWLCGASTAVEAEERRRVPRSRSQPESEAGASMKAIVGIQCPCGEVIDVDLRAELVLCEDGLHRIKIDPDMSDLWSHSWAAHPEAHE